MTCFRSRTVLLGVWMMNDVIWEKYAPKTPQKLAWIGSFKSKRQNLYIAIYPELLTRRTSDLKTEFRPRKALRGWSAITQKQIQHVWRLPSSKSMWRHNSSMHGPIWTKFGTRMHIYTSITAKWSRSKPEIEFQYDERLFFQNGSIAAVNWDMSTKCRLLVDFDLLKAATSTNTKPEVVLSGRGRYLEKWIYIYIFIITP